MSDSIHGIPTNTLDALRKLVGPDGSFEYDPEIGIMTLTFADGQELQYNIPNPTIN